MVGKRKDLSAEPGWQSVEVSPELGKLAVTAIWVKSDNPSGVVNICVDNERIRYWLHHDAVKWLNTRDYKSIPFPTMTYLIKCLGLDLEIPDPEDKSDTVWY